MHKSVYIINRGSTLDNMVSGALEIEVKYSLKSLPLMSCHSKQCHYGSKEHLSKDVCQENL